MSKTLEIPDDLYDALRETADAQGMSPVAWIAIHLGRTVNGETTKGKPPTGTLAERFAGRTGRIHSGSAQRLSEAGPDVFTDYLESKRQAGRL